MFWRAPAGLARPGDHLAHVEVNVLAPLGDRAVQRPDTTITGKRERGRALPPGRIGERRDQTVERRSDAGTGRRHQVPRSVSALNVVQPRDITYRGCNETAGVSDGRGFGREQDDAARARGDAAG